MRIWALVLLAGCGSPTVEIAGRVMTGFQSTDVVAGAKLELRDEAFGLFNVGETDADGIFRIDAPKRAPIFLVVMADDAVPASFPGESGDTSFTVPDGDLFTFSQEEADDWRKDFVGCPGAEAADGMIVGVTYLAVDVADVTTGPPEASAFAYVEDLDRTDPQQACYLNDEGTAYDATAERTGSSGRFALFGVSGGPWALTTARRSSDNTSVVGRQTVYVPEGGVLPRLPALVPLR